MLPDWALPGDPALACGALLLGLLLDLAYPEHRGILLRIHPVAIAFSLARRLAPPYSSKLRGVVATALVMAAILAPAGLALYIAWMIGPAVWLLVAGLIVKLSIPVRLLLDTVARVARSLGEGRLAEARMTVQGIVRRETSSLGPGHVASAAIESLSESLVDGITSPLLWYTIAGPLGALAQRTANTLDGALGYKTPEYRDPGWASARLDTIMNLIPARITAMLTVILAPLVGLSMRGALRTWTRFHSQIESLNAGHIMSAYAGALKVRLEKPGSYTLGEGRLPEAREIWLALRLTILIIVFSYMAVLVLCMYRSP
ncbi:MAG: cobalamin biosynthesis protein [Desulfurococcales archaeon]|nr:cobalamin biosynthesis protein [Desulfurococcales archaeon]